MIYLLDTNTVSDLIEQNQMVRQKVATAYSNGDDLGVCQPVYYELMRGFFHRPSPAKLAILQRQLLPTFVWLDLENDDWLYAARFWANARGQGRQINDVDLLVAAIAYRLKAIVVSSDNDFSPLPIPRENWRFPTV